MECKFIRATKIGERELDYYLYDIDGEVLAFSIVDKAMWPNMENTIVVWIDSDGSLIPVKVLKSCSIGDAVNQYIKQKYGEQ